MILGTQMTCAIVIPTPEVFDCHAEGVKSMRWQMIDGQMVQAGGVSRTTTPREVPAVPFAASLDTIVARARETGLTCELVMNNATCSSDEVIVDITNRRRDGVVQLFGAPFWTSCRIVSGQEGCRHAQEV